IGAGGGRAAGGPGGGRGGRGGGRGGRAAAPAGAAAAGADEEDAVAAADAQAAAVSFGRQSDTDGGGLTALVLAARENCLECAKNLIDARADVNEVTH